MSRFQLACGSALLVALLAAGHVAHAESSDDQPTATLDEVVVTAARGSSLKSLDVSTTTVSRAQVRQAPQTTLDQVVGHIPGVFTSQQPADQLHPTGQAFNIRGFGTTTNVNTLVTVDGVPMNDPYFRTVDWSQLPKAAVDSIEVIRGGGATSLWGDMAMGGVVNVVTEAPGPGDELAQLSYGSFNTSSGDLGLGFLPLSRLKVGLTYDVSRTDGYDQTPAPYRNPYMDSTHSLNSNLGLFAVATPTDASTFYVKFLDHQIAEHGLVWDIAHNDWDTERLTAGGSVKLNPATSLNVDGWYSWNRMATFNASTTPSFSIFTPSVGRPYLSQTESVRYSSYGGSAFVGSAWGPVTDIKVGADFRAISADDPLYLYASAASLGVIDASAQHQFEGVFGQGVLRVPAVPLEVTAGLREDFWQATHGLIHGDYRGSAFSDVLADQTYSHFDPRLGGKLHVTDAIDLRAAIYENFAAPGMNQMYRSFISGSGYTTSNPSLRPQTNLGEEAGLDVRQGGLSLSATAFYNRLKNFIDYATVQSGCALANDYCGTGIAALSGGTLHQYVNAGDAVLKGLEFLGSWRATDRLAFNAGYTLTDAYLTSSRYTAPSAGVIPDPVNQQLGQVPRWIATAGATWSPIRRLMLTLDLKSFPSYWNTTSHTQRNGGATLIDAGAQYQLTRELQVFGSIQNLGNERYYDQGLAYTTTNGSVINGSTIPALGLPFDATIGVRASF